MKTLACLLAAAGCALQVHDAAAQSYPAKPVRLIVGVQPGGNLDTVGRAVAEGLSNAFGRRVVVENRPGANASIGAEHVARSAPDGYTLLMIASTFTNAPSLARNIPYDPVHFTAYLKAETARAAQVARDAGIKPE